MAKTQVDKTYRIFYILIPVGAIVLGIIVNMIYDNYHETVLKKDTKEILNYLMTKDIETSEEYRELAINMYKEKNYDDADFLSIILGDDYLLLVKYHSFNDLRSLLNIFHIEWIDKSGYINDEQINEGMDKKSALVSAKYIARINEWKEAEIEEFKEDENEFFLNEQRKKLKTNLIQNSIQTQY